jgi:hypothetical protein
MRPPARKTTDFEKVRTGDFILGTIDKIEYENEHTFKGYQGAADKVAPAIRIVFKLEGYEYPHRSRWMNFNMGEKANLYKKYVTKLVANAKPDMDFDLDELIGMKVKTIWEDNGDFQNLESIYPAEQKRTVKEEKGQDGEYPSPPDDDFVPEYDDEPPM